MSRIVVFVGYRYIILISMLISFSMCRSTKILFALTKPHDSHFECGVRIAEYLTSHGHNVTFLVNEKDAKESDLTFYQGRFNFEFASKREAGGTDTGVDIFERIAKANFIGKIKISLEILDMVSGWWRRELEELITDSQLMDRIAHAQYDVIVVEGNFVFLIPFAQRHHQHFVALTTHAIHSINTEWFNLPSELSYIPFDDSFNKFRYNFRGERLSFFQRVLNIVQLFQKFHIHTLLGGEMAMAQDEYNVAPNTWGHDSFGLAEVWLTNADFSTDYPRPFAPNMGLVGGLTVRGASPLDEEFQAIYDAAGEAGVLVVSMGSVITSRDQLLVNSMASAFASLPQKVIWKATDPPPETVGDNTVLKKWIPQNDLLAHPSTRAMVYHCGNNGAFEALYQGIPIIGIPIFADQTDVAYRIMSEGMGLVVEITELTNETLLDAVTGVINNPRYKARAEELSAIYRDGFVPPAERAAFWIEYVLRHNGARLLRSRVAYMGFIQQYLLDVWCFCVCISLLLVLLTRRCASWLLSFRLYLTRV